MCIKKLTKEQSAASEPVRHLAGIAVVGPTEPRNTEKQSGAVEACWAHNPEVRGSKPRSAKFIVFVFKKLLHAANNI